MEGEGRRRDLGFGFWFFFFCCGSKDGIPEERKSVTVTT